MTAPLSNDLRERVVGAIEAGESCRSATVRFGVAVFLSLQRRQAAQLLGVSAASTGKHRPDGPEAHNALTIKPDHPIGALQMGQPSAWG
jgi:putative transposase